MTEQERALVQAQVRYLFIAIAFGGGSYFLFGGLARAVLLFATVITCFLLNLGRRWLVRSGLVFLILVFLVAFNIIPRPTAWADSIKNISGDFDFCRKAETSR
jgi:hypothetical protein